MTKQELMIDYADFLVSILESKNPEKLSMEGPLLDAYLYSYVLAYLRPDWFQSEKFNEAFCDMRDQIIGYREKSGKDIFFATIAKASNMVVGNDSGDAYGNEDIGFHVEINDGIIPTQDIGLILSKESKDRKFITRTLTRFLRRAFLRHKEAPMVLSAQRPKPTVPELLNRGCSILGSGSQLPGISASALGSSFMPSFSFQSNEATERREFMGEMWRYICVLMAETPYAEKILPEDLRWSYKKGDEGEYSWEVDVDSRFARDAACLNPDAQVCYRCRPEFRRLISTIYYVRNSRLPMAPLYSKNSEERARYFDLADAVLSPVMDEMEDEIRFQVDVSINALANQQRMEDLLNKSKQETRDLQAQLNELSNQTAAPELEQELARLKEEMAAVKRKAEADLARAKNDLSKLQAENKQLTENLAISQTAFHEINEQYIDLLEGQNLFLDDDDLQEQDTPPAPAGVRARIGDETYGKLASKRLAIVGGHASTQRVLRELFPNWRFFAVNEKIPDALSAVDAVAVLSRYTSHKNVEQARSAVKSSNIPMLMVNYNGPTSICNTLSKLV